MLRRAPRVSVPLKLPRRPACPGAAGPTRVECLQGSRPVACVTDRRRINHVIPDAGHGLQEGQGPIAGELISGWSRALTFDVPADPTPPTWRRAGLSVVRVSFAATHIRVGRTAITG